MVEAGKRVKVIADGEVIGTGVILAKDKRVLSPQDDEIQILMDTSTEEDTEIFSVFAGQEYFLTEV
mgnify:CR=1 FL=1|jgi:hypothetical protein